MVSYSEISYDVDGHVGYVGGGQFPIRRGGPSLLPRRIDDPAAEWIGWVGEEGGLNNAKRVLARKGTFELRVKFLEPFSPEDFRGRKAIAAESRDRIEKALLETLGKPLRKFAHDVPPIRYSKGDATEGPGAGPA